jgi:hypothetical protein
MMTRWIHSLMAWVVMDSFTLPDQPGWTLISIKTFFQLSPKPF